MTAARTPSTERLREELQRAYSERGRDLLAFAYRLTGSESAAEDVVHESVLRILDGRCRIQPGGGDLVLLLFGVVRNVAREQRRRVIQATPGDDVPAVSAEGRPENELAVRAAIAALSPTDREVIILSTYHGCSPREIAAVIGCSRVAVRVRLHRARTRLMRLLRDGPARVPKAAARLEFRS